MHKCHAAREFAWAGILIAIWVRYVPKLEVGGWGYTYSTQRREREPLELTFTVYQVQYLHTIFIKLRTWEGSKTGRGKILST